MKLRSLAVAGLAAALSGCEAVTLGNVLTGCATRPEPELMPKELPTAGAGEPYKVRLDVINASTPVSKLLVAPAQPLPDGLELIHVRPETHGVIQGVPTRAGSYEVRVYGNTFGTQCTGQDVERVYRLEVK
ncbi:hypothetical protein ACIGKL_03490 [Pseudomonas sp. NPDC077186]|uniref:hypothetical protein n=1 Tax=Pseudomonas sp. NPDC077186 TaxID=3364421 RepID=UPI0037C7CD70